MMLDRNGELFSLDLRTQQLAKLNQRQVEKRLSYITLSSDNWPLAACVARHYSTEKPDKS